MKRFSLIAMIVLIANVSMLKAQTTQGTFLVGVSSEMTAGGESNSFCKMGYSTRKYKDDVLNSSSDKIWSLGANASPRLGYFVIDNLAIGLNVCLSAEKTNMNNEYTTIYSLLGIGPFIRYYLPSEKVKPFFEIGGLYGHYGNKFSKINISNQLSKFINVGCGAGLAFPIGDNVSFDLQLNYDYYYDKEIIHNPENRRSNTSTVGLKLGFVVLLGS